MSMPRSRGGFTLVEVLMAAFVLAGAATGTIYATWKMAGDARLKASALAAESFCADIAMAYVSQDLNQMFSDPKYQTQCAYSNKFDSARKDEYRYLPRYRGKDIFNQPIDEIPFWRENYIDPVLTVWVTNAVTGAYRTKTVYVTLAWGERGNVNFKPATYTLEQREELE